MGNRVVLINDKAYQSNCDLPDGSDGFRASNNSIFLPSGKCKLCDDPLTTVETLPSDEQIIAWAKQLLA